MEIQKIIFFLKDTVIFLILLGILIVVHEFGHFLAALSVKIRVERFSVGFGRKVYSRRKKDTEFAISAIPLGGYVKLAGDNLKEYTGKDDEYYSKTPLQRMRVIFFGPLFNYLLGWLVFSLVFFLGYPTLTTKIAEPKKGFGAEAAGLKTQDRILSIDGQPVKYWEQMQKIIQYKKEGQEVRLLVERGQEKLEFMVRIKEDKLEDAVGIKRSIGLLGIIPAGEIVKVRHGILSSLGLGLQRCWFLTSLTYKAFWRMLSGKLSVRESVTGPLGVFYITSKSAELGFIALLHLLATLSVSLAVFNLLPLPILDGGHIVLLFLEKIRKKPLSTRVEELVNQLGLTLVITLAIFITLNDLFRFFGGQLLNFFR